MKSKKYNLTLAVSPTCHSNDALLTTISDKYKHGIDTPLLLVCVYDFWSSPDGREQAESDAYEPTVQVTQVGSKMVLNYAAAWGLFL